MKTSSEWLSDVENMVTRFVDDHSLVYSKKQRELSASFEIGCFHALLDYYEQMQFDISVENLTSDGEFRYLTSPSGNPNNFSFVVASLGERAYEIRQQLKIYSELDEFISFAPDLSVVKRNTHIEKVKDEDYAKGKRSFYRVSSKDVIAAHECKSLPPFPELMVSFIGMFVTAHSWHTDQTCGVTKDDTGLHLAPTLFVGGSAQAMHLKMIAAIQKVHPLNIVVGMHQGNWDLYGPHKKLNRLDVVGDREALTLAKPLSDFLTPVGLE